MSNALHGQIYQRAGVSWVFGRRSVGRINGMKGGPFSGTQSPRRPLSKSDKAELGRLVKGSPQVMVKIISRTYSASQLRRHVDYIRRKGDLELESEFGPVTDKEDVEIIRDSWIDHAKSHDTMSGNASRSAVTFNLMLSMPEGTDRVRFKEAVRSFVSQEFHGRHETLMAFHDDTDKPHAHISVLSRDHEGKALDTNRDCLDGWRGRFAERLRERGIDAAATPRHARGVTRKTLKRTDHYTKNTKRLLRNDQVNYGDAMAVAKGEKEPRRQPWKSNIAEKRQAVIATYEQAAAELARSDDRSDRALAQELAAFTEKMPRQIETRTDHIVRRMETAWRKKALEPDASTKHKALDRDAGDGRKGFEIHIPRNDGKEPER